MRKHAFALRAMELADIAGALDLSMAEGWNQTEREWKFLIENRQNICLLAEVEGKMTGTVAATNYGNEGAWIGMVLVDRAYRGLGVSKLLLGDIFRRLGSFRSIKLDATPAGQPVYQQFGFRDEYLIARMLNATLHYTGLHTFEVIPEAVQEKHIAEITAFDQSVFGNNRQQLFEFLIREFPGKGWLLKRENSITGFVLGRTGSRYHQIGPVVALTEADAKTLISKAMEGLNHLPVVADVLCDKEGIIDWLCAAGFARQRHFIRMHKNENNFPGKKDRQYLICGPEFG